MRTLSHIQPALLRPADLMIFLAIGRTALYKIIEEDPTFPPKVRLSKRAVAWRRKEVEEWLTNLPDDNRGTG